MTPTPHHSLRTMRWLPVITAAGLEHVTLDEALERAASIRGIGVRDPIVRAALNRFLIAVGTLVAREAGVTPRNVAGHARTGFTAAAVASALDLIDEHLWLVHETTPFMQLPDLARLADEGGAPVRPAAELFPRTPGATGKAWFDVAGDIYNPANLTPEQAAIGLITHWHYSPKSNVAALEMATVIGPDGTVAEKTLRWAHLGSVGMEGLHLERSLTFWHRGTTLAEFLLLNLSAAWLADDTLPAWASPYSTELPVHSLASSTYTANAALLVSEDEHTFAGVLRGGFPHSSDVEAAKKAANEQLVASNAEDPSRVWQDVTGKTGPTQRKLFTGFDLGHSTAQNLRAWILDAGIPDIKHGVLPSGTGAIDVLYLSASINFRMPNLTAAAWLTFNGAHLEPDDIARELVIELANTVAREPERALDEAIRKVFPNPASARVRTPAHKSALRSAVRSFHNSLEPLFGQAIADAAVGVTPANLIDDIQAAKAHAFDEAMKPYVNAKLTPLISRARADLADQVRRSHAQADTTTAFVGRFISQRQTDTRFRVALAGGSHPSTVKRAEQHLSHLELAGTELIGVTRALGLLARHRHLHHGDNSLGRALGRLATTGGRSTAELTGIRRKVELLTALDLEQAVIVLDSLLGRLTQAGIPVDFYDVVRTLRHWDSIADPRHRMTLTDAFHLTPQKAAA
ncbi:type I-E CRISPR-associated protein Cse1/CasA [Frigoribacterium sp. SL97]|uniref:type I-E CRISPR-associated protein Cse1/CasA n=1 Tax=Frigoribacterium sp. SL97 TaxID=2994664 RepID=UPI00226E861B|nr:type I-E CRISPR-associated protein Cse1/CasA [Frigoribacterium sp. SL97]WAC50250.1 type I-E CRISPR-associated protein Cse1/CasA [Frigoribacterium sp. SL97]